MTTDSNLRLAGVFFLCVSIGAVVEPAPIAAQELDEVLNQLAGDSEPRSSVDVLSQNAVLTELQLNNDQRSKIKSIIDDFNTKSDELQKSYDERLKGITSIGERLRKTAEFLRAVRTQTDEMRKQAEQSLLELLNDEQKEALKKKLPASASEPAGGDSSGGNAGSSSSNNGTSSPSRPSGGSTFSPRSSTSNTPAKRTADTFGSFAAVDDSERPQAEDAGTEEKPAGDGTKTSKPPAKTAKPKLMAFNFHEAPWRDVLKLFAKAADLTLNIRDEPPGTFTYYDRQKYTPTEALDVMNRYLQQDGFILVRFDKFLGVYDFKKGVPPNLIKTVPAADLENYGKTELLRVQFPLDDRDTATAVKEVQSLLGSVGKVFPLESAGSIVVIDTAKNLLNVKELIEPDRKVGKDELKFQAFALKHIDAEEAADIVRSLFGLQNGFQNVSAGQPGGSSSSRTSSRTSSRGSSGAERMRAFFGGGGPGGGGRTPSRTPSQASQPNQPAPSRAKVTVDMRTNSLLINATSAEMKLVEQIVESIDIPPGDGEGLKNLRKSREPYLEVYQLKSADATEVAKTLGVLHPGKVVNEDGRTRRIHIMATEEIQQEIAGHIRQLDGETAAGEKLAVVPLDGLNAYSVSTTLNSLYEGEEKGAPSIQFDPSGKNLIVRGDAGQIIQIQTMVGELAKFGPSDPADSGQTVRVMGASATTASFLSQAVSSLYPQVTISSTGTQQNQQSNRSSRSGNNNNRTSRGGSSSSDQDRARRIMEFRQRFFGGGGGDRGSSGGGFRPGGGGFRPGGGGFRPGGGGSPGRGGSPSSGGRGGR